MKKTDDTETERNFQKLHAEATVQRAIGTVGLYPKKNPHPTDVYVDNKWLKMTQVATTTKKNKLIRKPFSSISHQQNNDKAQLAERHVVVSV